MDGRQASKPFKSEGLESTLILVEACSWDAPLLADFGDIAQHLNQLERFKALPHDFRFYFKIGEWVLSRLKQQKEEPRKTTPAAQKRSSEQYRLAIARKFSLSSSTVERIIHERFPIKIKQALNYRNFENYLRVRGGGGGPVMSSLSKITLPSNFGLTHQPQE